MNKADMIQLVKIKIAEHRVEIEGADELRNKLAAQVKQVKKDLTKGQAGDILQVKNIFGAYEKIKFHKICIDVLTDLLQELEK